jgi:hypothetical protein
VKNTTEFAPPASANSMPISDPPPVLLVASTATPKPKKSWLFATAVWL